MTISTIAATIMIVGGTILLKLVEKEAEIEKEKFENFK